jgi:hypothetical protein
VRAYPRPSLRKGSVDVEFPQWVWTADLRLSRAERLSRADSGPSRPYPKRRGSTLPFVARETLATDQDP